MSTAAAAIVPRKRLGDRVNPILVKEVRQALRGKYFRVLFWLTLSVATLLGLTMIAAASANDQLGTVGSSFFLSMFAVLGAAVHGFVPFSAFLSTSAEWDENTYDLLVISNLEPRQIVNGKLCSALIQALLYYSTFGPFLVFAWLLNGVDLVALFVMLACSLATCVALSLVGVALSSLAAVKLARVILMALFGAGLVGAWGVGHALALGISLSPQTLRGADGQTMVAVYLSACFVVSALAAAIAMARFAHDEENRSTSMRVLTTLVLLAATAWGGWLYVQFHEQEFVWGCEIAGACVSLLLWLFFVTEPEELGRRVERHVPRRTALALLAAPFLPGGGRAVLLFALHFALALLGSQLALSFGGASADERFEVLAVVAIVYGYASLYLLLPSGVAAFFVHSGWARAMVRLGIVFAVPVSILAPALVGLFLDNRAWQDFEHPLNPLVPLQRATWSYGSSSSANELAIALLVLGALLALLLNLPRVVAGLREVARAARQRRERLAAPQR